MSALITADNVISNITARGGPDYSPVRSDIAELFDKTLWEGNWDATTDFEGMRNLRFIQEDEYDQHMDEDEQPDGMIGLIEGHYIFYV